MVNPTVTHIEEMYDGIKSYSLSVRQKVDWLLRCVLDRAVEKQLLKVNPCSKSLRPKRDPISSGPRSYSIDDVDAIDASFDLDALARFDAKR